MIQAFEHLSESDAQALFDAVPLITILIAGDEGKIDITEVNWARKVAHIRTYATDKVLFDFYEQVDQQFDERYTHFINLLPSDAATRGEAISQMLAHLNRPFQHMEPNYAYHLYRSFISFAKQVAKSSGGFFSFFSISKHEEKWLHLDMIDPIPRPDDFEEEE